LEKIMAIDINKILKASETAQPLPTARRREAGADGIWTAYAIHHVINDALAQLDATKFDVKPVAPQAMYGYRKAGRINGVKGADTFTEAEVSAFVARFIASRKIK
jgi:hypothetical protein